MGVVAAGAMACPSCTTVLSWTRLIAIHWVRYHLSLVTTIAFIRQSIKISNVACITQIRSNEYHVIVAAQHALTSAFSNHTFTILYFNCFSTLRTVYDSTLAWFTVCFDACETKPSGWVHITTTGHQNQMGALSAYSTCWRVFTGCCSCFTVFVFVLKNFFLFWFRLFDHIYNYKLTSWIPLYIS